MRYSQLLRCILNLVQEEQDGSGDKIELGSDTSYNDAGTCEVVQQIFLSFNRWMEIYTKDCKKSKDKQIAFQIRKIKQLDKLRNAILVKMQCVREEH